MRVVLSFDTEVWCNGWKRLDEEFPAAFERYVWGRSSRGDYALPKTLETLGAYGLKGVFFVEPLFAMRFGAGYLRQIVDMILEAGQEVQLHLHPEWTDESSKPLIDDCRRKRQHLSYYTFEEQTALISHGKAMLEEAGVQRIDAFRAGSFAANMDTFVALRKCGIATDSSLNACHEVSLQALPARDCVLPFRHEGVNEFPVTVFTDGFGRLRPVQVGACSFEEMRAALEGAYLDGWSVFVLVSHNFELLRPGKSEPDGYVVRRFERLCRYLADNRNRFETGGFPMDMQFPTSVNRALEVGRVPTLVRYIEQGARRLL